MTWININDRLPEERQPVLCWLSFDTEEPYFWQYVATQFAMGRFQTSQSERVTHWQPLPDPPSG